jgi:hypothetical protein
MKRPFFASVLLLAVIASFQFFEPAAAATAIGKVVAVTGGPKASGPGGDRVLGPGDSVYEDDRITTRAGGNAQIVFVDGTKLVVGPGSTLVIDRFLLRSGNKAKKFSIDALRGTFRFISGRSAKSAYDIQTSNATIGIRGTAFDFSSHGTTTLAVFSGLTALCSSGDCTNVGANCEVGRAGGGRSALLTGSSKKLAIQKNLPYILNQSALATQFRLNTSACGRIGPKPTYNDRNSDDKPAPPAAPPAPPDNNDDGNDDGDGDGDGNCTECG